MTDPGRPTAAGPEGRVHALHRKPERPDERGLPKIAVAEAIVTARGMEGDFNRWRHEKLADDPRNALLVVPLETLNDLEREGWPVRPGDLGENVTSVGLGYDTFAPGGRFLIGEAVVEVTKPCEPCRYLFGLPYVGAALGPAFLKTMVGRRGWYAAVLRPGRIRPGDPIRRIEPE